MKPLATLAAVGLILGAAGAAEAHSNVGIGLSISSGPAYAPVYAPPPVYAPAPVYYEPVPAYYYDPVYRPYTPSYRVRYWDGPGYWRDGRGQYHRRWR